MSRYFTEFVAYNLLPLKFSFKLEPVCFFIDLKKDYFSFTDMKAIVNLFSYGKIKVFITIPRIRRTASF